METYFEEQIKIIEEHKLTYQAITFKFVYDTEKKKINKTLEIFPSKYKDVTVNTREFIKGVYNGVAVMLGENYNGIILVDVDNVNNTLDIFKKIAKENILKKTLKSKTLNGGLYYYFYCVEE